jgi:DNA-binding protein H-NS
MSIDLTGLSIPDLEKLIDTAKTRIEQLKRQQLVELRRSLEQQAKEAGFDIYELFGGGRSSKAAGEKKPVAPKYRDPDNPNNTWSGRGKHPVWLREALAAGKTLESFAIK